MQLVDALLADQSAEHHSLLYLPLKNELSEQQMFQLSLSSQPIGVLMDNDKDIPVKFALLEDIKDEHGNDNKEGAKILLKSLFPDSMRVNLRRAYELKPPDDEIKRIKENKITWLKVRGVLCVV